MLPRPQFLNGGSVVGYALTYGSMTLVKFAEFLNEIHPNQSENGYGSSIDNLPFTIILDNASWHAPPRRSAYTSEAAHVHDVALMNNLDLLFMRPSSPQFNPAELIFSWIKKKVYDECPSNRRDLIRLIENAVNNLDPIHVKNMFVHCIHCIKLSTSEFSRLSSSRTLPGGRALANPPPPSNCPTMEILKMADDVNLVS